MSTSEIANVSAATVHLFTGNNIGPRGDLASRSLIVRLEVDRADPENRLFTHPDPIGWTRVNRGKILHALYVILLANPRFKQVADVGGGRGAGQHLAAGTRFKTWYHLVGAPLEHAATIAVHHGSGSTMEPVLDFAELFLSQEEDDEDDASLADALVALSERWPGGETLQRSVSFQAADLAKLINGPRLTKDTDEDCGTILREFLYPTLPPDKVVSAKSVGKRLKRHVGEPIEINHKTYILKEGNDPSGTAKGAHVYYVLIK